MSGCGCPGKAADTSGESRQVVEPPAERDGPCGAETTGLGEKFVDSEMSALKRQGPGGSPVRCKHGMGDQGREAL